MGKKTKLWRQAIFMYWKTCYFIVKMAILPKGIYQYNPYQNSNELFFFFADSQINMELQVATKSQRILKNENTIEEFTLLHFKTHHKPTETKTLWCQHN